ncbi:putative inner membrane protein [Salinisphaera sp. C84B14]|uniref:hypothetical protein n=1 Tax=Salinisphaera sp. C84B14 TaxID=1304155 RepID=UPI003341C052
MSVTAAEFGFDLSNRETATLIYLGLLLAGLLLWTKTRPLALNLVKTFFAPKLTKVWLVMSLYVAGCVGLLAWLQLWELTNLKSTLLWWMTVGFTGVFEAQRLKDKPHMLPRLVTEAFTISAVIFFVAELVSFPLFIELIMLPVLVLLTLLIAVCEHQVGRHNNAKVLKILRNTEMFAGVIVLCASCVFIANNVAVFWSFNTLREFGLPFLLWLMFVPFIYLLATYMTYEEAFVRLRTRPKQSSIVRYARWRALFSFGININGVKRLSRDMRVRDIADKQGVKDAIQEIKRLRKIEDNPPAVSRAEGWSPYEARLFLKEYGLITDHYHRTPWEWFAHIPSVKLNEKVLADRVSYYLSGNERAVTRLRIALDGFNQNDTKEAQQAFYERALTLLAKTFGSERATTIYRHVESAESGALAVDGIRLSLTKSDWGDASTGGFVWNFIIQHPQHREGG